MTLIVHDKYISKRSLPRNWCASVLYIDTDSFNVQIFLEADVYVVIFLNLFEFLVILDDSGRTINKKN